MGAVLAECWSRCQQDLRRRQEGGNAWRGGSQGPASPPSLRPREGSNDAALKRQSESVPSQVFLDPYHVRCMQDTAYVRPRPTITTHTQVGDGNLFSDRLSSGAPNVRMEQYQLGGQTCKDIAPPRPSRATHRNCTVPFLPSGCARSYARLGQGEAARSGP